VGLIVWEAGGRADSEGGVKVCVWDMKLKMFGYTPHMQEY